jgi:hypothetical protein
MNPLLVEALGSIVRAGLNVCAGWLVAHGIWSSSNAEKYVGAAALALISLGWSLWQHYGMRSKLITALATPATMSEHQIEGIVNDPTVLTPSVMTPNNEAPASISPVPPKAA